MTILTIAALLLLSVACSGLHRLYIWLAAGLSSIARPSSARRYAFVAMTVLVMALAWPFLTPHDFVIETLLWVAYLGLAGVGAWNIYDLLLQLQKNTRNGK